ncbi:MAG: hypothetical protein AAGD09_11455 [Cyanobacteria bacterium P01_F01_bin.56]
MVMTSDAPLKDDYRVEDLPQSLQEVEEVIGFAATLKFVEAFGGLEITIPKTITLDHALAEAIGLEEAIKLSWAFPSIVYKVPLARAMHIAARNRLIKRLKANKVKTNDIAKQVGLGVRQVQSVLYES